MGGKVRQTKEKMKRYIVKIIVLLIMILIVSMVIFMPFIVNAIYDCPPPAGIFDVELSKSDILDYYAQVLSLLATILLGAIAIIQTYRSQKKTDEINALQLSIAQRELAVVEKQYEAENETAKALVPRFEIKLDGYSGNYCKIKLQIKNTSEMLISAFQSISFEVQKSSGEVVPVKQWKVKFQSIASSEVQHVQIFTPDMRENINKMGKVEFWEHVNLVWKFSCEDCKGNRYFYAASIFIPSTKEYKGDFWKIKQIG
jgi:hypothetical protein